MYSANLDEKKKKGDYESGSGLLGDEAVAPVSNADSSGSVKKNEEFKWDGTWGGYLGSKPKGMWGEAFDPEKSTERFRKSFTGYMAPKDTPFRRRSQFALSQPALDDVVNDYYNTVLKPRFLEKKEASKKRGRDEYTRYAGVVGGDPTNAMRYAMKADDPVAVINETMGEIDNETLLRLASPLAEYGGFDAGEYVEQFVKPSLRNRMINEYVEENKPRSSAEYVLRSSLENSLIGKMSTWALDKSLGDNAHIALSREGLERYDSGRMEDFAAGVGSLIVDMPIFSGIGSAYTPLLGRGIKWSVNKAAAKVLARSRSSYMTAGYAKKIAERAVKESLSAKIYQSSLGQGLTLGTYDVANSVADDIIYGEGVDLGKAAGAFARGFATGGAAGAVGAPLRSASAGLTGGKKLLASSGVLSAESAVFTTAGEVDKLLQGVEIEPVDLLYDFAESTATLMTMKLANWRPKGGDFKLDSNGKIKEKFALTETEKRELRAMNISPEDFLLSIEMELKLPSFGGSNAEKIKQQYAELMANKELSASTRAKLMFLVENKLTSTPPLVFDYAAGRGEDGKWYLETYDNSGNVIEKLYFRDSESAKSHLIRERANFRRNRIAVFERELTSGLNSQNFLRQAGIYAREKGIELDRLSDMLYKKANGEALGEADNAIIKEILTRTAYDENGMVQFLHDTRMAIEKKYNLPEGSLLSVVNEHFYRCTDMQNKALDEYEVIIRSEVERLKGGTSPAIAAEMLKKGRASRFKGMSNDEVKSEEILTYETWLNEKGIERANGKPVQVQGESIIDISKKEWSPELVEELKTHIPRLTKMFGHEIDVISRPEDLTPPDPKDAYAVRDYNTQMSAQGWYWNDKVSINLMNIKSVEELERTVVHEVVGHAGLERIFGNYYREFLEEVYRRADKSVRDAINRQKAANPLYDTVRLTEEYLAGLVETAYLNPKERSVMRRFKDFIRNMLVRLNIYSGKNRTINEDELLHIMKRHCDYVIKGKETSLHRSEVFGGFESAKYSEGGYGDRSLYNADISRRIQDGTYFRGTPEGFLNDKLETGYYALPKEERWRLSELIKRRRAENERKRDDVRYRFIGEKGAGRIALRGGETEDASLEKAKRFEESGLSPDDIRLRTGWERGVDGKWRYELAEKKNSMKDVIFEHSFANNAGDMKSYLYNSNLPRSSWPAQFKQMWEAAVADADSKGYRLSDIVNDKDLFATYPEFAGMRVRFLPKMAEPVFYNGREKELWVDGALFMMPDAEKHMAGAIQNIIQDYENFSKAIALRYDSNNDEYRDEYYRARNMIRSITNISKVVPDFDTGNYIDDAFKREYGVGMSEFDKAFPTLEEFILYKNSGNNVAFSGNVELENVKRRYGMNAYERRYTPSRMTEGFPRDKQLVIQSLDDLDIYLQGPLDIIKKNVGRYFPENPLSTEEMLGKPSLHSGWNRGGNAPGSYRTDRFFDDETGKYYDWREKYKEELKKFGGEDGVTN